MNRRIKELEKQCWSHRVDGALVDGHLHFDAKKFAGLIVRECLDQCYNRGMNDELYAGQLKAAAYIEEHFGVK